MNSRFLGPRRTVLAAALVTLTMATTASAFLSFPPVYMIQGYLDYAPTGTKVIDRIQITATAKPTRWLLVTSYRNPGDVFLNRYLSRELMSPYWVRGKSEDVARLLGTAEGTEIKGTFVVYTEDLRGC